MRARIWYLGHSAWCVETEKKRLVFDYVSPAAKSGGLESGIVNPADLRDKDLVFFASHSHADHYDRALHKESAAWPHVTWVLGDISPLGNGVKVKGRSTLQAGNMTVHTAKSTDAGCCFLTEADGLRVFHAGDNADWGDPGDGTAYYAEIDYLASLGIPVDAAFIPVCTFSGERPACMTRGALYAVRKLDPKYVFPMHGNGREYLYEEFRRDAEKELQNPIICMKRPGDFMDLDIL
ncbi:MAG: MBL fold metallo-hydrolase [Defluviitaleaceae bacterium]|nr:MBL fold metallo-hydrolase [Defluviitaleaceae bacterium]